MEIPMKRLLSAVTLAFAALVGQAQAESFVLYERGSWQVSYVSAPNGTRFCHAVSTSSNVSSAAFRISSDGRDPNITIYDNRINYDGLSGRISMWIDRRQSWYGDVEGTGNTLFLWNPNRDFMAELYQGNVFYVDMANDGHAEYAFSLQGSAAAMIALADCISKL
jgi:hypothetical protein